MIADRLFVLCMKAFSRTQWLARVCLNRKQLEEFYAYQEAVIALRKSEL